MAANSPEELSQVFAAAINAGDVDAAGECWSEDAIIVAPDGSAIRGPSAIAEELQGLVASGASLNIELTGLYTAGGSALATGRLRISVPGQEPYEGSDSVVLYARGNDGVWRVTIDAPWGLPAG
jgi:ketosteroid isomerase-like protein